MSDNVRYKTVYAAVRNVIFRFVAIIYLGLYKVYCSRTRIGGAAWRPTYLFTQQRPQPSQREECGGAGFREVLWGGGESESVRQEGRGTRCRGSRQFVSRFSGEGPPRVTFRRSRRASVLLVLDVFSVCVVFICKYFEE